MRKSNKQTSSSTFSPTALAGVVASSVVRPFNYRCRHPPQQQQTSTFNKNNNSNGNGDGSSFPSSLNATKTVEGGRRSHRTNITSRSRSGSGSSPPTPPPPTPNTTTTLSSSSAPSRMPVPLAVLFHFLFGTMATPPSTTLSNPSIGSSSPGSTYYTSSSAGGGVPSPAPSPWISPSSLPLPLLHHVEVEVECRQGYVYTGTLVAVDEFYNLTLGENTTVRRQRLCDIERQLIREKYTSLLEGAGGGLGGGQGSRYLDLIPQELVERPHSPALPSHVGPISIRSSHIFMIRFVSTQSGGDSRAGDVCSTTTATTSTPSYHRSTFLASPTSNVFQQRMYQGRHGQEDHAPHTSSPESSAARGESAEEGGCGSGGSTGAAMHLFTNTTTTTSSSIEDLVNCFTATAVGVKKALAKQKEYNRAERRKRMNMAAKKEEKEETKKKKR